MEWMKSKKGNEEMEKGKNFAELLTEANERNTFETATVTLSLPWFETLVQCRTKYTTLVNYLLNEAEVRNGSLSIYTNVADILCSLEPLRTGAVLDKWAMMEEE